MTYDLGVVVIGTERTSDGPRERCRYQFQHEDVDRSVVAALLRDFADRLEQMGEPVEISKRRGQPRCGGCDEVGHRWSACPRRKDAGTRLGTGEVEAGS